MGGKYNLQHAQNANMLKTLVFLPVLISINTQTSRNMGLINNVIISTQERVQLVVPFTHQIEDLEENSKPIMKSSACGPSALTMSFNYLGENNKLDDVINKLPTDVYIKGDKFYNLPKGAEIFGKKSVEIDQTPKAIFSALENGHPVILNVQNYDGITGHALVVTGMRGFDGEHAKYLIVHDPYVGPYRSFEYINDSTLTQPEGYSLPIGILKPFYITN